MDRRHLVRICFAILLGLMCSRGLQARELLRGLTDHGKRADSVGRFAELGPVLAEGNGHRVHAGPAGGLSWIDVLPGRGDGGGADVVGPLTVIQTDYSDPENGNVVLLIWEETAVNAGGVDVLIDGELAVTFLNPTGQPIEFLFVTNVPPGTYVFGVRETGVPDVTAIEGSLSVIEAQPFSDAGSLSCRGIPGADPLRCSLLAEWMNPGPFPSYYLLLLDEDAERTTDVGSATSLVIDGVGAGEHDLTLLGFAEETPGNPFSLYRGGFVESRCTLSCEFRSVRFLRGLCGTGSGALDLSNAVFLLNFLFLGGATPSCLEACDVDASSVLDLSDAVFLLNFLFLGGLPPPTWPDVDNDGDGRRDATCEEVPEDRCRVEQEACS